MIKKLSILLMLTASVVVLLGAFTLLSSPALAAAQPSANAPAASSASYQLDWDVVSSGGTTMQSTSYTMHSTTGQAITTPMSGSSYSMKNGFWSGMLDAFYDVFLPLIIK